MKSPLFRLPALLLFCLAVTTAAFAQDATATQTAITSLLQEFLAKNSERAQHDRFWADDLVYTSALGVVRAKAEIMKGFDEDKALPADAKQSAGQTPAAQQAGTVQTAKSKEPAATYSAEDIVVRAYGTTAALTFRLVAHNPDGKIQYYRNSGTFLFRNGRWQAVTWQATKVPEAK